MQDQQNETAQALARIVLGTADLAGKLEVFNAEMVKISQKVESVAAILPDIVRVVNEHANDIDALKASQEFIGKSIAGLRKDIDELKKFIGYA